MNLPNTLTTIRMILIVPFVMIMQITPDGNGRFAALAIFIIASMTDFLDGYIARKNHLVTNFGKFMDPLADKLLVSAAMICLVSMDRLPAWMVIIIISREFAISGFRLIAADNGIVIAASWWGKFKTVSQMIMIILLIANLGGIFTILEQIFMWVALILTVVSLADYIWKNKKVLNMQS
ncbi:CDP-diacylglycerol--glycerol-3-phosphate 3-phosphatidyltransferase [uncultured Clostridium sp.]|uniref:CDP-diacylglycerol--glycerol-3-phosphate 3-phosphatidyltransferase n=1 Tax=Muricoprocola aceti TaxID=2981772 RepID=A0ABT2SIF1_9FIRM|nr:CDP-diacylglycerol--glycerol-3-phosphate 3-phosphatidyltransferase [Muricoprocola aceti]MCI7225737.1 CDP-diacylglycerol--glycerol-3-phosphate 3-phosphatidyltransferase [Lachnospiraceae bacterium]MCQ4772439.1 CDP-diacylglycerol--glycerol-3-phosphate 3-phosphatidyltransferase [Lacrimispora saccharolytica]RGD64525.1 CDP-diacylglycerol--glycerol-3-phosphate 3-phosphatidyltransferase [Lachnospiraceae bacterium OF09-6]SCG97626.1 CDP-diacylglycerol--glycerol-3-phosphate 3-phosphatidyltransferase [u